MTNEKKKTILSQQTIDVYNIHPLKERSVTTFFVNLQ